MIIYFCNRDLEILGNASTTLPDGYRISDDLTTEEIDTGVNTFSCVISYTADTRTDLEDAVQVGNYILKQSARGDDDNAYDSVYQIIETEFDTLSQELQVYAEDAGLDLLNTLCPAVSLSGNVWQMMRWFLPDDWTINLIDAPVSTKVYTWDGEATCTERLLSVANIWDCEIYYSFVIDRLQVKEKVVNVTKKRGNQEAIPQLRLNYDLDRIYTKKSIADLVTALKVTGVTPEGSDEPVTLVGYGYTYTDPATGDEYAVDTATGQMRNLSAMARWSSAIDADGLWVGSFTFDTTDQAVLAGEARAYLQRHSQVEVNYEVDFDSLPDDIRIGDRVNIIDEQGELYLEARILKIETCEADDTQKAVIGEYLLRSGGIADRVAQLASDLSNQIATDNVIKDRMKILTETIDGIYILEVDSDVLLQQAHLTAKLLKGNVDVKSSFDPTWFKWILRNEDGEELLGRGYTLDVDMGIIGYASTILCRFVRPQLYGLTDHNNVAITNEDLEPLQVAFAGIYSQPVTRRLRALRSTAETGLPTVTREVNLYEKDGLRKMLNEETKIAQYFWHIEEGSEAGAHVTEVSKDEFLADPERAGGNLLAKSDGIVVRDGLTPRASFGEQIILGDPAPDFNKSYVTVDTNGLKVNKYSNYAPLQSVPLAEFGIASGYVQESVSFTSNTNWTYTLNNEPRDTINLMYRVMGYQSVYHTFTAGTAETYNRLTYDGDRTFTWSRNPAMSTLHFTRFDYNASVANGGYASIGVRDAGYIKQANTATFGSQLSAEEQFQVATGKYNATRDSNGDLAHYAFMVGNGERNSRSNALAVDWNGNVSISGTLTQSSDKRLKHHISYLEEDADEFIRSLKPACYDMKGCHVGFYAQDVKDPWGGLTDEMNGYMTLNYTEIIAPLVRYCQHLEERIAELEKGKE